MKTVYGKIMVLAAAAMVLVIAMPLNAQGKGEKPGWEAERGGPGPRHMLTEEGIDRIMNRLKETDPNKAAELEKLRDKDPNEFRAALRGIMREHFRERALPGEGNMPGPCPKEEMIREKLRDRGDEYLEWLKANYPAEAERLAELKNDKPEIYKRQLWLGARKYGRIAEAAKENPELAKVLKQDLELRNQSFDILRKIKATADEAEKQKLTGELEKVTSDRFDVILKRKQMEYDQMQKELARLTEHVKQSESQLENWKVNKADKVKERVNNLLSKTEKFEWD